LTDLADYRRSAPQFRPLNAVICGRPRHVGKRSRILQVPFSAASAPSCSAAFHHKTELASQPCSVKIRPQLIEPEQFATFSAWTASRSSDSMSALSSRSGLLRRDDHLWWAAGRCGVQGNVRLFNAHQRYALSGRVLRLKQGDEDAERVKGSVRHTSAGHQAR
jgi:hypothetical protein